MAKLKFKHSERRRKRNEYERRERREEKASGQAPEIPARIQSQQRRRLDQATGGEILDENPDMAKTSRSIKILHAIDRKQRKQMRQIIGDAIFGDAPEEDTDGQQEAGQ